MRRNRRRRRHENGDHDKLRHHCADRGIPARRLEVLGPETFVGHCGLMIENHPRHDHRPDVRRDEVEITFVGDRDANGLSREAGQIRMGRPRHPEEGEFKQADRNRRAFDPAIGPGQYDQKQRSPGKREAERSGHSVELADACNAREFSEQGAGGGDRQAADGNPRPSPAKGLLDQLPMAATGEYPQPHREFLDHVQDRHEDELQQQQSVAPLHAALPGGDDAANVSVSQHHHDARTQNGHETPKPAVKAAGATGELLASC